MIGDKAIEHKEIEVKLFLLVHILQLIINLILGKNVVAISFIVRIRFKFG